MTNEILPTNNNGQRGSFLAHPFSALHDDMNRLFDRYVPNRLTHLFSDDDDMNYFARMDVSETDKAIEIKLDVPGVEEKDIDVKINDNMLTIKGKRETSTDEEKDNFRRVERSYGSFMRRIELPTDIDEAKIDAVVKKGVLSLSIPKSEKAIAKEHKIKIKSA